MPRSTSVRSLFFVSLLALAACDRGVATPAAAQRALGTIGGTLRWGTAIDQVGFRPARPEAQAQGVSALALDPLGRVLLVDRLNGRVLRVGDRTEAIAQIAQDIDLVAVAPDGALALYSALRARVELVDPTGAKIGSIEVPRVLGEVRALGFGPSRRITLATTLQERYDLGSPSYPLPLEVVLASRQEGSVALPEHRGAAVRVEKGAAALWIYDPHAERASIPARVLSLPGRIDAAQLVGADGTTACLRTESLTAGAVIDVARRVVCIDTTSGRVRLDRALPAPGVFAPRAELAVGSGMVAGMIPGADGLELTTYAFGGGGAR